MAVYPQEPNIESTTIADSGGTNLLSVSAAGAAKVDGSAVTQPISGTVTVTQATGTNLHAVLDSGTTTVTQATGTNLHTVLDSGTLTSITNALPAGSNVIGHVIADSGSTTAVTGNVTVTQATGTNLHVVNDASSAVIGHIIADSGSTTAVTGNVTVVQPTGTNLHVVVDTAPSTAVTGTVTSNQGTAAAATAGWPNTSGQTAAVTAAWTSATTVNTALTINTTGYGTVRLSFNPVPSGSFSGGEVTFEVSDDGGTTWYTTNGAEILSGSNSGRLDSVFTLAGNIPSIWHFDSSGFTQVRVRLDTVITGAGTLNVNMIAFAGAWAGTVIPVQSTPAQLQMTATPITLTKGTQGATGFSVQDLKDAGRQFITLTADAVAGVTSDTLVTFSLNKFGTVTAAQTNYTVTNGKTLRVQAFFAAVQSGAAAGEWVRAKLRVNPAGATTASSPLVFTISGGTSGATSANVGNALLAIPDGLEIGGNGTLTIGLSHISSATTNVESITLVGYEY